MPGPGGLGLKVKGGGESSVLENASRSGIFVCLLL